MLLSPRQALNHFYAKRRQAGLVDAAHQLFPLEVEALLEEVFGYRVEFVEQFEEDPFGTAHDLPAHAIAGVLDRTARCVTLATARSQSEWRRFTMAHETGHIAQHTQLIAHRDRWMIGGELADRTRPREEREADRYAADLLMPPRYLRRHFASLLGKPLDHRRVDRDMVEWLRAGTGRRVTSEDIRDRGARAFALLIAETGVFGGQAFQPLRSHFGVSATAIAIQLQHLGLVR